MKILIVLGHLGKESGGVYSVIKNYTNFLIKNHEVSILGARSQSNDYQNEFDKNVNFLFYDLKYSLLFKKPIHNINKNILNSFDIIWFHGAYMNWGSLIADSINFRIIYTPHGGYNFINLGFLRIIRRLSFFADELKIIKHSKNIHCITGREYDFLKRFFSTKTLFLPNYIFKDLKTRTSRKKIGDFVYVGRLDPPKNILFLLEVMKKMNINIDIFGFFWKSSNENYKKDVQSNKYFIKSFKGELKNSDVKNNLQNYRYLILPSKFDGLPVIIFEAVESNIIPIISDQILLPRYIEEYIPRIEINDIAKTIKSLEEYINIKDWEYEELLQKLKNVLRTNLSPKVLDNLLY